MELKMTPLPLPTDLFEREARERHLLAPETKAHYCTYVGRIR